MPSSPILAEQVPLRILLAEDNIVNQKVALQLLKRLGYRADVAGNGLEVLAALHRQSYDVVLMDVQMPELDGLSTTRRICQQWPSLRPWIIAMTANAMQGDREECLEAGMNDYVSKPIRLEQLVQTLSRCPMPAHNRAPGCVESGLETLDEMVLQALRDMAGVADSEFLTEMIDSYLEDAVQLLQAVSAAVAQEDAFSLKQAAHTLKSTSAALGAMALSKLCSKLEAMAHSGIIENAPPLVLRTETEFAKVQAALQLKRQNELQH